MNTMNFCRTALSIASLVATTGSAFAATMAKADYTSAKDRISAEYKTDKDACASYNGNAKDVCLEQAKGKEQVAKAELEYNYSGKPADSKKLAIAKADSAYAVSKEMCDDKGGNSKDVCVTEAKATHTKALADAKMSGKVGEAKKDAMDDKRDADYKVATEKCDALTGNAKSSCISAAKVRFNKS